MKLATLLGAISAVALVLHPPLIAQINPPTHTFRDEVSKIVLTYPAEMAVTLQYFTPIPSEHRDDPKRAAHDACRTIPFSASSTVSEGFHFYVESRTEGPCLEVGELTPRWLAIFTHEYLVGSLSKLGAEYVVSSDIISGHLSGHDAMTQTGQVTSRMKNMVFTLYLAYTCALVKGDILCLVLTSSIEDGLKMLEHLPVQFEGHPPTPILPLADTKIVELTDRYELRDKEAPQPAMTDPTQ